jgi:hypothetical protein
MKDEYNALRNCEVSQWQVFHFLVQAITARKLPPSKSEITEACGNPGHEISFAKCWRRLAAVLLEAIFCGAGTDRKPIEGIRG